MCGTRRRGRVRTILGDVSHDKLGFTSMHEHLASRADVWWDPNGYAVSVQGIRPEAHVTAELAGVLQRNPRALLDNLRLDDIDITCAEVACFAEAGGGTIVELT